MANYASNVEEYIKNIITDVLPASDLARMEVTPSGLVPLTKNNSVDWPIELPDSVGAGLYHHEKSSTTRHGVLADTSTSTLNPVYHSYYFRPFSGVLSCFDKLVAQSILELYPTPVQTYGSVVHDSIVAGGVVDLNYLRTKEGKLGVKAIRLDMLLNSLGFDKEINSFADLQAFMKSPIVRQFLSERAIVQIGLESYAMPNAVGEVDSNSRNIIVLIDPITGKGEYVCRIDAESNTYFNDINKERSGKSILPKGIFHGNEFFETEFLKAIREKDSSIDWDLFASLTFLASKLTSTDMIDRAVFNGFKRNYHRVPFDKIRETSAAHNHFNFPVYKDFSQASIDRAKRYHDAVFSQIGRRLEHMPFEGMNVGVPNSLEMQPLNAKGKPLTPDEEKEYGLQ